MCTRTADTLSGACWDSLLHGWSRGSKLKLFSRGFDFSKLQLFISRGLDFRHSSNGKSKLKPIMSILA